MTVPGHLEPGTWIAYSLAVIASWVRGYLTSGCAAETLLLALGPPNHWTVPKYTLIAILNTAWGLAATSWLFHTIFTVVCWPLVLATCALQYAVVSSFTRGRLRRLWKDAHFTRDRVAIFGIPTLRLDTGIAGLVTLRGITISLLDMVIELHGVEISMDLGSGHELLILSDGIKMKLFREIIVGEICGVHWFNGNLDQPELEVHRRDSHMDDRAPPMSKGAERLGAATRPSDSSPNSRKKDIVKDKISRVMSNGSQADAPVEAAPGATTEERQPPDEKVRNKKLRAALARNDLEADEHYDYTLAELKRTNRLFQSRERVTKAREESTIEINERTELQHTVCADLRTTKTPQSGTAGEISMTRLMELSEPVSRFLDRVPILLRALLWLLTQSHAISCPSVCFTAAGPFLGGAVLDQLFRHNATVDKRINQLKREVSSWLCAANIYVELTDITAQSSVPVLTTNNITCDLRSKGVVVSRIGADVANSGRVAQLHGADGSFSIPTCLLPSHEYAAPSRPDSSEDPDTAPVTMSVRASLPAFFSEDSLRFAATLCKTSQMLDIEEEAGLATEEQSTSTDASNPLTKGGSCSCQDDEDKECAVHSHPRFRDKLGHGKLRAAMKHPIQQAKQTLHKGVKRTAVDNVDGAWFIKWVNKFLKQMERMDGDLGYTQDIPVTIKRGEASRAG